MLRRVETFGSERMLSSNRGLAMDIRELDRDGDSHQNRLNSEDAGQRDCPFSGPLISIGDRSTVYLRVVDGNQGGSRQASGNKEVKAMSPLRIDPGLQKGLFPVTSDDMNSEDFSHVISRDSPNAQASLHKSASAGDWSKDRKISGLPYSASLNQQSTGLIQAVHGPISLRGGITPQLHQVLHHGQREPVPPEVTGSCVKLELCSPGPATPIQAAPLPQQKPREVSTSCSRVASTKAMHSFEAATMLPSTPLKSMSASTQDPGQCYKEYTSLLTHLGATKHVVGQPLLNHTLASSGATKPVAKDEDEPLLPSKTTEDERSLSSCGVLERSTSDRSVTSMGRPSAKVKVESPRFSLDAGLCVGSNVVQLSGSKERGRGEFSRVFENGAGGAGLSGVTYLPCNGTEGAGAMELPQGRCVDDRLGTVEMAMDDEWKGKHLEVSFDFQGDNKVDDGRVARTVEHRFSEVLDPNVRADQGSKDCRDSSGDRWTKRVKREVVEIGLTVDESREHVWETNEDQDRVRSGTYEKQNQQDHFRSLFLRSGGAALLPQGYREKALSSGEPRTMVVKKTPKRVHNSDPNAVFMRPELLMLEESAKGSRSMSHLMLTPSNKQGVNGVILAGELVSEQSLRKSANLVRGVEGVGEYMRGVEDISSVQQLQLEPGLDRGSMSSLVSASKHVLSMGEPALPLTLNFSPKPQRAVVSSCRTSTEEEWGKSLALSGPGAESAGEVERSGEDAKAMSYQERFVQLQVFLKKCDEDDQSFLLDALRSLSAVGRSSHAVALEQRALMLSIEEGKEMNRLKSLNVMGQKGNLKGPSELGCTPQGPRVASFGIGGEHPQQQLPNQLRSPQLQMQMQMLMSGSKGGSAYTERYHFT